MSHTPHDSPYRDAPSVSSGSPASTATSRNAGPADRPARKPAVSRSPRQQPAPQDSASTKPTRSRSRRRRGGSGAVVTELTSVPTSRNAYVATRAWLLAEHGPVCAYCGVKFTASVMTLDHVAPRRGLTAYDRRDNLVLACPGCNQLKRDQSPLAFLLGSRMRAFYMLKYGGHLSVMLVDMARSLAPEDMLATLEESCTVTANVGSSSGGGWATLADLDDESPYRD